MTFLLLILCILSAIGGLLFGYDTGVISGAMLLMRRDFALSSIMQEIIVSVTVGAAAIFSVISGFFNNHFGRKKTVIISSCLFVVGSIIMATARTVAFILIGRVFVGMAIGFASTTVPIYLAECSPASTRGLVVTINQLFITGGLFLASLLDGAFSYDVQNGWRFMLGLAAVPAGLQLIGFIFMPESPRWLVHHGHIERAREVLQSLRGFKTDIDEEFESMTTGNQEVSNATISESKLVVLEILKTSSVRRALLIGCCLQMFQQLGGINTVMYYSATILKMAGVGDDSRAIWYSSLVSSVNFLFTLVGLFLIDRIGRRKLLLSSLAGVSASLTILGIGFYYIRELSIPVFDGGDKLCSIYSTCDDCIAGQKCGFCYRPATHIHVTYCLSYNETRGINPACNSSDKVWLRDYCPTSYAWIVIVGMMLYLAFFAPGLGPVPWAVNSEIYPIWARGTAMSITTMVNWIFNLIVSISFLSLTKAITKAGVFWLYACIATFAFLFCVLFLPETKGMRLESANPFSSGWCVIGRHSDEEQRPLVLDRSYKESDSAS